MVDELLYKLDIDENTCWRSHDNDGNLISQRLYQTDSTDSDRFICYCDIPCYPTGLFLHLKITGPIRPLNTSTVRITEVSRIYYYPYTGLLKIYDEKGTTEVTSYCFVQSCWGSCIPKTYCTSSHKIFGYHDFQLQKTEGDLSSKWYYCKNDQIVWCKKGTFWVTSNSTTLIPGNNTASATVWLPEGLTIADVNSIKVSNISSSSVAYDSYQLIESNNSISLKFRFTGSGINSSVITFTCNVEVICGGVIKDLQNISRIVFIDPNLWVFTPRTVIKTQSFDELQLYPVYKVSDDEESQHQAIYWLNSSSVTGSFDFLSPAVLFYQKELELNRSLNLGYGYTSNAPYDKLENGVLTPVSTPALDLAPYKNTDSFGNIPFWPTKISRFGLQGKGLNSWIEDCPIRIKDKFLMEEEDKPIANNLLTHTTTLYSKDNPKYWLFDHLYPSTTKGFTTLLDQFHFMCQDQVYRIPLGWNAAVLKWGSTVKSVRASNIASRIGKYGGDSEDQIVFPFIGGCFTYNWKNSNNYSISNPQTPSINIATEEYQKEKILFEGSSSAIYFLREQEDIDLHEKITVWKYSIPWQKYISLEHDSFYKYPTGKYSNDSLSSLYTSSWFLYYDPSNKLWRGCPPLEVRLYTCEPEWLQRSVNPFTTKPFPYGINNDDNPAYPAGGNQSLMNTYYDLKASDYWKPTSDNRDLFTYTDAGLFNYQDYKINRISISKDRSLDNFAVVYKQQWRHNFSGEQDAASWIYVLVGFMNSGYKVDLSFKLNREYVALSYFTADPNNPQLAISTNARTIDEKTYPNDYYKRCLEFESNTIFNRSKPGSHRNIIRTCANTATFPMLSELEKIEIPTHYQYIPYNGIPLLPVRRAEKSLTENDSFFGTERFFNQQVESSLGSSFGLDFYVQLFNQEVYTPYNLVVLTWPKEPVEEE